MPETKSQETVREPRAFCYRCHKARSVCVCESIQRVENRTKVLVVQHPREQRHPIGSLRFAELGLDNCEVAVAENNAQGELKAAMEFPEGAALLYPGADARELAELDSQERPSALVLLDGTWSTVRKLLAGDRRLRELPRVGITPRVAGNYRIRREPRVECLSTLEALIEALRVLEPKRDRQWDGLITAFDTMIDKQIEIVNSRGRPRSARTTQRQQFRAVPHRLGLEHGPLVAVSVESTQINRIGEAGTRWRRQVVRLSAVRIGAEGQHDRFDQLVRIAGQLPGSTQLSFMGLTRAQIESGCSETELGSRWGEFVRSEDRLCAWNQVTLDLVPELAGAPARERFVLKGLYADLRRQRAGELEAACAREDLPVRVQVPTAGDGASGRAAIRLAATETIARWLMSQRPSSCA